MKTRRGTCLPALLIFLVMGFSLAMPGQGIKFVKSIDFTKSVEKKSISSFLLGRKKQTISKPGSICRITNSLLCAADAVNGEVIILEKDGKIKKRITRFKGGRLISPVSCCTDEKGNLYISDSARRVVLQFDRRYKFKRIFIAYPGSRITGILFSKGLFYCVDTQGHRILCFERDGSLKFSFGKRGAGEGEFNFPTHITADSNYIYVTDAMNFRVQVFNRKGKFIRHFGVMGRGGGTFSKPKGIAVDPGQRIFIADAMFDNVQIFNTKGEFLYYFGGPGHGEGEFWMPSDVLVDSDNLIWVADTYNSRIQVFKLTKEAR